ncbi:MAG: SUF system NifU family Fe-S cluster assembly protein [Armatimonadetes bacterium]|nr:SUF system NifU family Fe-S cluster assembly protein [Armatimonadota bacterium]
MSLSDDLYRDIILEHHKNPHHYGTLEPADVSVEGVNPLCGDECHITLKLDDGRIADIKANPRGCAISRASTSMMTDAVIGKSLEEAHATVQKFKHMMLGPGTADELPEEMEDIEALEGVKVLPARIKCAVLSWDTLLEGMREVEQKKD